MPTILLHGTVIGKWRKKNRKLTLTLFTEVSTEDVAVIEEKAVSLWGNTIEIIKEN